MSFTLQDLLGTLLGFAIGGVFFLPPGIANGYLTNVPPFRRRPVLHHALLAVVFYGHRKRGVFISNLAYCLV